jgi:hypothetical protein
LLADNGWQKQGNKEIVTFDQAAISIEILVDCKKENFYKSGVVDEDITVLTPNRMEKYRVVSKYLQY